MARLFLAGLVLAVVSLFLEAGSVRLLRRHHTPHAPSVVTEPLSDSRVNLVAEEPETADEAEEDEKEDEAAVEESAEDEEKPEEKVDEKDKAADEKDDEATETKDDAKAGEAKEEKTKAADDESSDAPEADGDKIIEDEKKHEADVDKKEADGEDDEGSGDNSTSAHNDTADESNDDIADWESPKPNEFSKNMRGLPDQGFDEHSDKVISSQKGHVGDWQEEWPQNRETEEQSMARICHDNPSSDWCRLWLADQRKQHAPRPASHDTWGWTF